MLRHLAEVGGEVPSEAEIWRLSFWSADWTPWRALATLGGRWPQLRFEARPRYNEQA